MIIAAIDRPRAVKPSAENNFRGRDSAFWLEQFFSGIPFYPISESKQPFDFILIFHIDHFFASLEESQLKAITDFLHAQDPKQNGTYSFPGFPFFAVPQSFFGGQQKPVRPGVFNELLNHSEIQYFPDAKPVQVYHPGLHPLACEWLVIDFQVRQLARQGVHIVDHSHFYVEGGSEIGQSSLLATGVVITGNSVIGQNVHIHPHCYIENSRIGDNCILLPGSIIIDSELEKNVQVGPYCHLRMGTIIRTGAKVGNFVEMKKSSFGEGSKAMHLSYVGDATVGKSVNIGAGTITCNFDGEKKNPTFIEDGVFIGSGTELIAPVTVHRNAYVAAGSTVTEEVPENALAIARERQRNIEGWVLRKRNKKKE